jgi:hypothetical protein
MKKRDKKKRGRREKMIWRGGNQFGLKNNALLELLDGGDCGPDCSSLISVCDRLLLLLLWFA